MEKKVFNRVGLFYIIGSIMVLAVLFIAIPAVFISSFSAEVGGIISLISILLGCIVTALIINFLPKILNRTLADALPEKKRSATMIMRNTAVLTGAIPIRGVVRTNYIVPVFSLTFEFSDGIRKDFAVPMQVFNTIKDNESGILTYKEQGKKRFFVRFDR